MIYGYARVSTDKQDTQLQIDALVLSGVPADMVYKDKLSGKNVERPALQNLLRTLQPGDTVVVWKLDRLGRSLTDILAITEGFNKQGVTFKSIQDNLDTSTPTGTLLFHFLAVFAEFERKVILQRVRAGVAAAKARGVRFGKKPKLTYTQVKELRQDMTAKVLTLSQICEKFDLTPSAVHKYARGDRNGWDPKFERKDDRDPGTESH